MDIKRTYQPSAVIILNELKTNSIILTRRADTLRVQPGEICFPGGLKEAVDLDLYQTALRELEEELGIAAVRVEMKAKLEADKTIFHAEITPWLAEIEDIEPYQMNVGEVQELIKVPLDEVLNESNYEIQQLEKYGMQIESLVFTGSHHLVWGVTARMMRQLLSYFS